MEENHAKKVAEIVRDAGGQIVGRTRLQKVAYLLHAAGVCRDFPFAYRHYGPYSEALATAAREAGLQDLIEETEKSAAWGGQYSIFTTNLKGKSEATKSGRQLAADAAQAGSIELELAATALFLAQEGAADPWAETARRKPEKAEGGRLEGAKALYDRLRRIKTPIALPPLG